MKISIRDRIRVALIAIPSRRRKVAAAAAAVVALAGVITLTGTTAAQADAKHVVWVGSPIAGSWDLPASAGGDGPVQHHLLSNTAEPSDWAVDLIANAGQTVTLNAAPVLPSVVITAHVDQVGASCASGGGGSFATIGFYDGSTGQRLGTATYAHLQLQVSEGQTINRWGTVLGTVGTYPEERNCWSGPHVHFEMMATAPNWACFNKGYSLGYPLSPTNFLGSTGGTTNTGPRQACP